MSLRWQGLPAWRMARTGPGRRTEMSQVRNQACGVWIREAASSSLASQPSSSFIDQLATLQTRLIDVLAGYGTMQEKAEPEIQPIINEYIETHTRHEHQLAERLTTLGHKADEDGSFFSVVQEVR